MLNKLSLEAALEGELNDHLGYSKHERTETGNSRNGISKKTLQTEEGVLETDAPETGTAALLPSWSKNTSIACVDDLKGFPDAIHAVYPDTRIQLCIVHMLRNSLKFVTYKDYKTVTADLKQIYQSVTEEEALEALMPSQVVGTINIPRSAKAGKLTGRTSTHSLIIKMPPPKRSTPLTRLNRSIVLFAR